MKRQILFATFILLSFVAQPVLADTPATTPTTAITPAVSIAPTTSALGADSLVSKIQQAKVLLNGESLSYNLSPTYKKVTIGKGKKKVAKKVLSGVTLTSKELDLAILDPATNQIVIAHGTQRGNQVLFNEPNFDISQRGFNGVNTRFVVSRPAGGIVLALKYLITGPESGSEAGVKSSMAEVVYVPYSPALNTPEVSKVGEEYLNGIVAQVATQLRNVPSAGNSSQMVTDAIKPNIVKALIYAEHMDTSEFLGTPDVQSLIDKLNVSFAGNGPDTFKFAVSTANARGISQFVPGTYYSIVQRHPEANLNPDFVAGMADHINAIKAQYLLLDDYTADVQARTAQDYNPAYALDYGAASYNGGVTRVARAVKAYGTLWFMDQSAKVNSLQTLVNSDGSKLASLKRQRKAAKTASAKTSLDAQISATNSELSGFNSQLTTYQNAALRTETVHYLEKMHKLIQVFNNEVI